jgi:hypothetical protein
VIDAQHLNNLIFDPIGHNIRQTGDHQLFGAWHTADTAYPRLFSYKRNRPDDFQHYLYGHGGAIRGNIGLNLVEIKKRRLKPANAHLVLPPI